MLLFFNLILLLLLIKIFLVTGIFLFTRKLRVVFAELTRYGITFTHFFLFLVNITKYENNYLNSINFCIKPSRPIFSYCEIHFYFLTRFLENYINAVVKSILIRYLPL